MRRRVIIAAVSVAVPSAVTGYLHSRVQEERPLEAIIANFMRRFSAFCSNAVGSGDDSTIVDTHFFSRYSSWDDNWDKRQPVAPEKDQKEGGTLDSSGADTFDKKSEKVEKSTATRNLILIRHGQYDMSASEDAHRILTDLGKVQAKQTGLRLKEMGVSLDKIVHSSMTRAVETAKIIYSQLSPDVPMHSCDMLREGAPYRPDPYVRHWKPTSHQFFQDGARTEAAFRKYFYRASPEQKENSTEVLICHANVIRYFVCRALQIPPEAWLRMSIGNCSFTFITIRPNGRVSLRGLGDTGHLPPDNATFN